jgi:ABC-type siderophore export system fused ATPase/permease subunit
LLQLAPRIFETQINPSPHQNDAQQIFLSIRILEFMKGPLVTFNLTRRDVLKASVAATALAAFATTARAEDIPMKPEAGTLKMELRYSSFNSTHPQPLFSTCQLQPRLRQIVRDLHSYQGISTDLELSFKAHGNVGAQANMAV